MPSYCVAAKTPVESYLKMKKQNLHQAPHTVFALPFYSRRSDKALRAREKTNARFNARFFNPKEDIENFTHTIIETESMLPNPPFEPQADHIDQMQRSIDWALSRDSVLVRLPRKREFPKVNIKPRAKYGIHSERAERNVLKSMASYSQEVLSRQTLEDKGKFEGYLNLNSLSYPQCRLLLERDSHHIGLNLFIDHMTVSRDPLPIINPSPVETELKRITDIHPRTWRSLLEKTNNYSNDWSFKFPPRLHPRTIYLSARIKRDLPDEEMLARNVAHAFGLTNQLARHCSHELPIVLQVISYRSQPKEAFFFTRYQLNTLEFGAMKNQAWHSGPVEDRSLAFSYFLDFENLDTSETFKELIRKKAASIE